MRREEKEITEDETLNNVKGVQSKIKYEFNFTLTPKAPQKFLTREQLNNREKGKSLSGSTCDLP